MLTLANAQRLSTFSFGRIIQIATILSAFSFQFYTEPQAKLRQHGFSDVNKNLEITNTYPFLNELLVGFSRPKKKKKEVFQYILNSILKLNFVICLEEICMNRKNYPEADYWRLKLDLHLAGIFQLSHVLTPIFSHWNLLLGFTQHKEQE